MKGATTQNLFHRAIILLFLAIIFIPPVKMSLSPAQEFSETEKRRLTPMPAWPGSLADMQSYFRQIDAYLNDHFGYRDLLISRYYKEIASYFGKTGIESKVLLGQEGWYYFTANNQLEDYQGKKKLSTAELSRWIAERDNRKTWLASLGIEYILLSPPGKHSIYPEYLPEKVQALKGASRYEQLLEFTRKMPLPYLVDLQEPLRQAKGKRDLYFRSDTHWNMHGAYVAYLTIVHELRKRFPEEEFKTDFEFGPDTILQCNQRPKNCDLARMAMHQDEIDEIFPTIAEFKRCSRPRSFKHYTLSDFSQSRDKPSYAKGCTTKDLTALVFRDSFFVDIQPFLSENFRHVVYLWKDYDQRNVEEIFEVYTPDVVIEAVVERNLFDGL